MISTKRLLACGVVAGPLFVVAFLVQGATRAHYDPLRHPVSSLALGDLGWMQSANFIIAGLLTLAFAVGLRRAMSPGRGTVRGSTWGPVLVGTWALSLIGAGIFTTDPVSGYPPGSAGKLPEFSGVTAALHDGLAVPGFLALGVAGVVFTLRFVGQRRLGWAVYSSLTLAVYVAAFVLFTLGFEQNEALVGLGGLFQRVAVASEYCYSSLLAIHFMRSLDSVR